MQLVDNNTQARWFTMVNASNLHLTALPEQFSRAVKIKRNMFKQLKSGLLSGAHQSIHVFEHQLNTREKNDLLTLAGFVECNLVFHDEQNDSLFEQLSFEFDERTYTEDRVATHTIH